MDKEAVLDLLRNIYVHKYAGFSPLDVLTFTIEKGLLVRTELGNFQLSDKGLALLKGDIIWQDI